MWRHPRRGCPWCSRCAPENQNARVIRSPSGYSDRRPAVGRSKRAGVDARSPGSRHSAHRRRNRSLRASRRCNGDNDRQALLEDSGALGPRDRDLVLVVINTATSAGGPDTCARIKADRQARQPCGRRRGGSPIADPRRARVRSGPRLRRRSSSTMLTGIAFVVSPRIRGRRARRIRSRIYDHEYLGRPAADHPHAAQARLLSRLPLGIVGAAARG